jgi:P27 family predicted phage terminase small subunit
VQGYAAQEWARIAPELYRLGLLTAVDVSVLASYCLGYSRWRQSEELIARMAENDAMAGLLVKGADGVHKNPLLRVSRIAVDQMMQAASQLGLTPIARTRLAAGIHGQPSLGKFSGLLGDG